MRFLENVPRSSTGTILERSFFIVGWGKKLPFIHPSAKTHYAGARVVPCSAMPSLLLAHEGMVSSLLRDMQRLPQQKDTLSVLHFFFVGEGLEILVLNSKGGMEGIVSGQKNSCDAARRMVKQI